MRKFAKIAAVFLSACCMFLCACTPIRIHKKFYECTVSFYVYPTFEEYDEGRYAGYTGYPIEELEKVASMLAEDEFTQKLISRTDKTATKDLLFEIGNGLTYSFEQYQDADPTYRSTYLEVKVSVKEDETLCIALCDAIETEIPPLVEAQLFIPQGYKGTACNLVTRSAVTTTMK